MAGEPAAVAGGGATKPSTGLFQRSADEAAIGGAHLRLVVHHHLAAFDRAGQLHLQVPPVGRVTIAQRRGCECVVLPLGTRPLERGLGATQQEVGVALATGLLLHEGATSVLDLGCGAGRLLALLVQQPRFTRITGVDLSTSALAVARG